MANKRSVKRISEKKRNKPKIRFNPWMMIIIFALSFVGCFALYMVAANVDENFFKDEFNKESVIYDNSQNQNESSSAEVLEDVTEGSSQVAITNPVPLSAAVDASYFENCCLVSDSTLLSISNYTEFKDVIGNTSLNAISINDVKVDSNYGTVTVYETLKIKKPMNVYIMLGSDIGVSTTDDMISSYTTFISNLKASIPETKIYIMQFPPVYSETATVTNEIINAYNHKLLALANSYGVYCIDINLALKTNEDSLAEEYYSSESGGLSEKAYTDICGYILTHTA